MEFQQLRGLFHDLTSWKGRTVTGNGSISQIIRSVSKVPQLAVEVRDALLKMFRTPPYLASRLKAAQDPKALQCISIEEVHECHREPGIINGYRYENCSVVEAVLSLFRATNETVNFWTHFLPTLYFLWLFFSLSSTMPLFSEPYLFPFVCYMATSCAYPLMSCLAHAFSCLSVTATYVCFFMDYATLSLYSWGAAILYYSYVLPDSMFYSFYATIFIPVAAVNAVVSTIMACSSRFVSMPLARKSLRLGAFAIPYFWDSVPLIYRLIYCDYYNDSCSQSGLYHTRQFIGVFLAAFFYGSHIPERLAPGRFDFVGHSHNLLHLFGIVATYEQLRGALIDLNGRRSSLEALNWTTPTEWVTIVTPIIVAINVGLIVFFTKKLNNSEINQLKSKAI